jgi:hypothetical protein
MNTAGVLFLLVMAIGVPVLAIGGAPRAALMHAAFALAALPLMLSAILHFVPVLTRSGAPHKAIAAIPWLAAAIGLSVVAALAAGTAEARAALAPLAAALGIVVATLVAWVLLRARRTLGRPHPGVLWYAAALSVFLAGLVAAVAMVLAPAAFDVAYRVHVHVNLLGWIGLTVLGTMPVLLPTALGAPDPGVAVRLRRTLPWAVAAVIAIAAGAGARSPGSAAVGAAILIGIAMLNARAWLPLFRSGTRRPGPAVSLAAGAAFLALLLATGIAHGFGIAALDGSRLLPAFAAGFLLPTVLGALAQLLPVWRHPGPDSPARRREAERLARGAGWRGALAFTSGVGCLVGWPGALAPAAVSALWMLFAVAQPWFGRDRPPAPRD